MLEGYGAPHAPGGGQGGNVSLPSSGGGGLSGFDASLANGAIRAAISGAAGLAAQGAINVAYAVMYGPELAAPGIGWTVAAVAAIVLFVLSLFGIDIFGGGGSRPTLPPMLYRFFHYVAAKFLGLLPCLAPNMYDSAAVEAAAMFSSPVAVPSSAPLSMSGDPYGGRLTEAAEYRKPPPPEYRNGTPKLPFGPCAGMWLSLTAPASVGCGIWGLACAGGTLPACPLSAGACLAVVTEVLGCYGESLGKPFPGFNEGVPPGGVEQPPPAPVP
jgi:hypothetical protein